MALIEFKNLPDTSTPLTAGNLNNNFEYLDNKIDGVEQEIPQVGNTKSNSTTDTYSCDYLNKLHNYSTEEQVVGTWIDGKPLYRKVIDFGALPNATRKAVAHNIANIDWVVNTCAILKAGTSFAQLPNIATPGASSAYTSYWVSWEVSATNIVIVTERDRSSNTAYVILEYTKTTD